MSDILDYAWRFSRQWQRALLFTRAGSLTFTTILALVPLMVMMAAFLSLSSFSVALQPSIESFLFNNFVPNSSQAILGYLQHFTAQAWQMSWWSIGFLMMTALRILFTLEDSLNAIWQRPARRNWRSLVIMAVLLLVSPILIIGSFILPVPLLPLIFSFAAFVSIFKILPHVHVNWSAALVGGLSAAVIFEIAKYLFAWYVIVFPSYERIYGIAAAIPLFFLWLYCSWLITFFGALVSYAWQTKGAYDVDAAKPMPRP